MEKVTIHTRLFQDHKKTDSCSKALSIYDDELVGLDLPSKNNEK